MHTTGFVPKVLVAGNVEQFRARLRANQAAQVVGSVAFVGKHNDQSFDLLKDQKLLLDNRLVDVTVLKDMSDNGTFDYIVFPDHLNYLRHTPYLRKNAVHATRLMTLDFFEHNIDARFYSYVNDELLFRLLRIKKIRSLLDVDAYFADSQFYVKPSALEQLPIDCLRSPTKHFPILDDFYSRAYNSVIDCRFRHYDAILLTAERDSNSLRAEIESMREMTDNFIVFARHQAEVSKILPAPNVKGINGGWFVLKNNRAEDSSIYVVSHKKHSITDLPNGYVTIHAGRALGTDLGYIGDNTGDNISELNPYLNELTALYWIWKNAPQQIVGIAHYRRFFSNKTGNKFNVADILTGDQARELLNHYDMLIGNESMFPANSQRCVMVYDAEYNEQLAVSAINVIKKMLGRHQPEYVDAFEQIMNGQCLFPCHMMITRKYVFDAYCQWLFSFILPAFEEFRGSLENVSVRRKRILGFIAERMFGVWLLKNRLRLREFPIMVAQ
mgnify:CR=1 FL=1